MTRPREVSRLGDGEADCLGKAHCLNDMEAPCPREKLCLREGLEELKDALIPAWTPFIFVIT